MYLTTLETLQQAKSRLENPRTTFRFSDWTACTCGHIYTAATGRKTQSRTQDRVHAARRGVYADVIVQVAVALGIRDHEDYSFLKSDEAVKPSYAAHFVSDLTITTGNERRLSDPDSSGEVQRADAIAVIDKAIAVIEEREREARMAVLGEAAKVVNAVEVAVAEQELVEV